MKGEKISLGSVIKARRKELGYTQVEVAERSGITQAHVSRIESGAYNSTFETVMNLAHALDMSPFELYKAAERKAV